MELQLVPMTGLGTQLKQKEQQEIETSGLVHISYGAGFSKFMKCSPDKLAGVLSRLIAGSWKRFIVDIPGQGVFHVSSKHGQISEQRRVA